VEPTTDRVAVRTALAGVIGIRSVLRSQYNLRPSEIVDITAQSVAASASSVAARGRATLDAASALTDPAVVVQQRECPTDPECVSRIFSEASALALHLEGQAAISLGGLEQVIRALGVLPGQKAVVLLSAGVLVSDRPGGRPDVGDVARPMGQMAAEAGVSVYTVHVDPSFSGLYSATKRRSSGDERDRDRGMLGQWLEAYSAAAGALPCADGVAVQSAVEAARATINARVMRTVLSRAAGRRRQIGPVSRISKSRRTLQPASGYRRIRIRSAARRPTAGCGRSRPARRR
jgi:hypothetical protein